MTQSRPTLFNSKFKTSEQVTNVDQRGSNLSTTLHVAASEGNIKLIKSLLDKGANINAQNCHGHTPLHFAISNKKTKAAKVLIDNGADPHIKCYPLLSATALEWAQGIHGTYRDFSDFKNEEIANYIVKNYCPEKKSNTFNK